MCVSAQLDSWLLWGSRATADCGERWTAELVGKQRQGCRRLAVRTVNAFIARRLVGIQLRCGSARC